MIGKLSVSFWMNMIRLSILGSLILIFSSVVFGYSVVLYPYDSITFPLFSGAVIEDFEDTTLIPGLVASVTGGGPPPGSDTNCVWDGTHCSSDQSIDRDFSFFSIPNVRGFGIGIADNDDWGCEFITVNNSFTFYPSDYPNYSYSGTSQTYYLIIVAEPEDPNITSVSFYGCTLFFDHLELDQGVVVLIDIKPNSYPNSINTRSKGKIPVAILSSMDFDAPTEVDTESLTFGPFGDEESLAFCSPSPEDVNDDGYDDLVCHFYTQMIGFECGDEEGMLKGQTVDGTPLEGSDSVRIVPSACR